METYLELVQSRDHLEPKNVIPPRIQLSGTHSRAHGSEKMSYKDGSVSCCMIGRGSPLCPVDVRISAKKEGKEIISRRHAEVLRITSSAVPVGTC